MKKILLMAAVAASVALTANAQKNYVVNGDFEQTEGVEFTTPWDWDLTKQFLTALPGWELKQMDPWCVLAMLADTEIDGKLTFEGNTKCLHVYRFDDNGWQSGTVCQTVKGLTVGQDYVLGAIIARAGGTTVDWEDPYFSISILPLDENCEEFGAAVLFDDRDEALSETEFWSAYEHKFKATTANVRLSITHNNQKWDGNHSDGFWMDVDDIAIMTPEDYKTYFDGKEAAGIADVAVEGVGEELGVYNLNGVRVADNVEALGDAAGLYIVRTTNGAKKVIR